MTTRVLDDPGRREPPDRDPHGLRLDGLVRLAAHLGGTPMAALFADGDEGPRVLAAHGCVAAEVSHEQATGPGCREAVPLVTADGKQVGELVVFGGPPATQGGEPRGLLHDLARLALALLESWRLAAALARTAPQDPLTGLANRREIEQALRSAVARAERGLGTPSLVVVDVDGFQEVNHAFGRAAGDALLRAVAERLTAATRVVDTVGRLGADEFAVLLEHTGGTGAVAALGRLRAALAEVPVTAAFGVATYRPGDGAASLLARADAEMYAEKAARA
ncbi:MAG TPA: GGDEF domain-containing protein [Actinomycetes bacterium]